MKKNFLFYFFSSCLAYGGEGSIPPQSVSEETMGSSEILSHLKRDLQLAPYENVVIDRYLFLLPIGPDHGKYLYCAYSDPKIMKYYGNGKTKTPDEVDRLVSLRALKNQEGSETCFWLIVTHEGVAGQISIVNYPLEEAKELFYCVSLSGKGIATMASQAAIEWMGGKFYATVHPLNAPSIAVLKKLGFKADPDRQNVERYGSVRNYFVRDPLKENE